MPKRSFKQAYSPRVSKKSRGKNESKNVIDKKRSWKTGSATLSTKFQAEEEITSDEEDLEDPDNYEENSAGENEIDDDEEEEDEDEKETAEEKRRRLAKQYLSTITQIEAKSKGDLEFSDSKDSDEESAENYVNVAERLKRERLRKAGKFYQELGEHFQSMSQEDITFWHCYGHTGSITSLALTSDETSIYTGGKDNSVIQWDTETGQKLVIKRKWQTTLDERQSRHGETLAVAVTSDGKYAASGGRDSIVRIYDSRQKFAEIHAFTGHRDAVTALAFQTGTYSLFSSSLDRCVKYWDLSEMGYVETLFGHQDGVSAIDCWHKRRPLTSSSDRSIRLWKVDDSSHLIFRGHKAPIDAVRILSEEQFISGSQDGRICLWNHGKKTPINTFQASHGLDEASRTPRWVSSLATIKASDTFASGSNDGFVRIWSAREGKIAQTAEIPMVGFVNDLAITHRILVAACSREHRLGRWWNMKGSRDRLTIARFGEDISQLAGSNHQESPDSDDEDDGEEDRDTEDGEEDSTE